MRYWPAFWNRRQTEEHLEKEIRYHLEQHTRDLIAGGLQPDDAQRQARLALGGPEQVKESCREARPTAWLDNLLLDVKYAFRAYRRTPAFTFSALLTIALGVGMTSAVFSVTDKILFRPLPYTAGDRLVSVGMLAKVVDDGEFFFAGDYRDLSRANNPFQSITSWSGVSDCDITEQAPIRQRCAEVDSNFLAVLGVRAILGDSFTANDVRTGAPRVAILTNGLWRSRYAADRNVIGRIISLDGAPSRIVGVLASDFELPTLQHADLLIPQVIAASALNPGSTRVLRAIGRLKDGVTLESARLQLQPFFYRILSMVPAPFRNEVQFRVRSMRDRQMGDYRLPAWTLLAGAFAVLLITCINVANLLLARLASRHAELAIRRAIGVSRKRLVTQLLTESLLLALSGGALGCLLGALALRLLISADPSSIPHLAEASLDMRVLIFALSISIVSGLIFGLAPIFEPTSDVPPSSHSVAPKSITLFKNSLVVTQIAASIVLLSAAGLLTRSLWKLESQRLGMQIQHVLTAQMVLPSSRYQKPEERLAFFNQLEQRMKSIPGMRAAGLSDSLPPAGFERSRPLFVLKVVGRPRKSSGTGGLVNWRYVSPDYFEALRIPVIEGRNFQDNDRRSGVNLCILSQSLENRLFPLHDAVGQHLKIDSNASYEIVGITPDIKNVGLAAAPNPEYYILRTHSLDDTYLNSTGPVAQRTLSLSLRSDMPDAELVERVKRQIADLDSTLPMQIGFMHERLGELASGPRFYAVLLLAFAGVGLVLAFIGVYGTVAYLVNQRTKEIGIRISLGASPLTIAGLMMSYSAKWAFLGASIGLIVALAASRLLSSLLFGVSPRDPLTLIASFLCLTLASLMAAWGPSRRAATTDPVIALRNDN